MQYLLYLPKDYDDLANRWPLVLFLHGKGESGSDLAKVKTHGPPKLVEAKNDYPFILVSPQSPHGGWDPQALCALLDDIVARYRVDGDKIYLTGLSMGGYGAWALAAYAPDRFAAIVPICGCGRTTDAKKLVNLAIWVFHGAKDQVVPLAQSEAMVNALKAAGSDAKFTIYPDAGHDSWTATYDNPELWRWLLQQKRRPGSGSRSGS
jgi:predicted peptidase